MTPEEIQKEFREAKDVVKRLHANVTKGAQELGRLGSVLSATENYWVNIAAEKGSDPGLNSMFESGKAFVSGLSSTLCAAASAISIPLETIGFASASGISFGANTAVTSSLVILEVPGKFSAEAIPTKDYSQDKALPERLSKLDPALGKTCAQIWECLYGTMADPEKSALYMLRQTWDHLFDKLAPDDEVRTSEFWTQPSEGKKDLVTREQRIQYAAANHVTNPETRNVLLASSRLMLDMYQRLNAAHTRDEIDRDKARRTLRSIYAWLEQWAEALKL
jgi:hypothetical protein